MQHRRLGHNGPRVSALGLGCNRMSLKQPRNDAESIATIQASIDAGINLLNTADFYGSGHNESLIGKAFKGRRDDVFISVKCGAMFDPQMTFLGIDGRPEAIKNFAAYSLQRLGVEAIDLYQPCRKDPQVPYAETIGAIKDLITEGKVRYLGVSEVGAQDLRIAHDIHPVTAIEIEYSLACRFSEREILPTARPLGIGIIPYRVLADGILSATAQPIPASAAHQMAAPRLQGDNYYHNMAVAAQLDQLAGAKGVSPAQLAIAWILAQGDDLVPLVGMTSTGRLAENLAILDISFTADELAFLDNAFAPDNIIGDRYAPAVMPFVAR
ncbi:aldo/keto reductase [Shimwellia pseudoproteus]|uniref:aldo/keto reductase n=1 Tax=Shimwellia pseudoproteus TaxID=570012 RepID=UPI0018EB4016|nr:aldo/keto reductase [Shimwellia pseudoproteus]MBJ3815548.1 aldo/keto reductase [Shimwellia pseudoproteus]